MESIRIAVDGRRTYPVAALVVFAAMLYAALFHVLSGPGMAPANSSCISALQSPPAATPSILQNRGNSSSEEVIVLEPDETQKDRIARLLHEADALVRDGRYTAALEKVNQAQSIDRENANVLVMTIRIRNGLQNENDLAYLVNEADAYFKDSQFSAAAGLYREYIDRHPEQLPVLQERMVTCSFNLGVLALRRGECALAKDYFRQSLFLDPGHLPSSKALELARGCVDSGGTAQNLYADALPQLLAPGTPLP